VLVDSSKLSTSAGFQMAWNRASGATLLVVITIAWCVTEVIVLDNPLGTSVLSSIHVHMCVTVSSSVDYDMGAGADASGI
jgi:hypothetical protein